MPAKNYNVDPLKRSKEFTSPLNDGVGMVGRTVQPKNPGAPGKNLFKELEQKTKGDIPGHKNY